MAWIVSMTSSRSRTLPFTVALILAFAIDQITKALAVANANSLANGISVFPGFNLVLYRNTGISFGLLGDIQPWALVAIATSISIWFCFLAYRTERRDEGLGYGLIVGGALGNVLDRMRLGGVTDFLDFFVGRTHWPAFNLADTAIFCGVAVLIISALLQTRNK